MEGEGAGFPWAAEPLPQRWGPGQMPQPRWDGDAAVMGVVPPGQGWRAWGWPCDSVGGLMAPSDAACRALPMRGAEMGTGVGTGMGTRHGVQL